jgi:hypothetical protein
MARKRNEPPAPEPPEVDPSTGIRLLQQQLEKGRALLGNRPLSKDEYSSWELITRNYLEKAFGRHSPNVRSVTDVGKFGLVPVDGEERRERHRVESLQTQLSRLEGLIELLQTEVQLQGHGTIKPAVEVTGHRIFLVHGHDQAALQETARFLERLDQDILILREQPNQGRTIIEKFEEYADVGFAVVLLTPDDRGGTATQAYDAQRPRARQNVILELGYFLGRLGRKRVCALYRPGVEIPSGEMAGVRSCNPAFRAEQVSGADGPQRTFFGYLLRLLLWAAGHRKRSASKEIIHVHRILQGHRLLFRLRSTMMQEEGNHGNRDVLAYTG